MALNQKELWSDTTRTAYPRVDAENVEVKEFAGGTAETLAVLTPLVYNATNDDYQVWADTDTAIVDGFVWPDPVTTAASGEVLGQVMVDGQVHMDDIALPSGETLSILKDALRNNTSTHRLRIEGLQGSN